MIERDLVFARAAQNLERVPSELLSEFRCRISFPYLEDEPGPSLECCWHNVILSYQQWGVRKKTCTKPMYIIPNIALYSSWPTLFAATGEELCIRALVDEGRPEEIEYATQGRDPPPCVGQMRR